MNTKVTRTHREAGAVSLFVVIFAALLMTVVTLSFIQLMTKDQEQATASDLSQSAYDSAQAGVEDAKRLLLMNQACLTHSAPAAVDCAKVAEALTPQPGQQETKCDSLSRAQLVAAQNGEVPIQKTAGDAALDQAYTCVKITPNTTSYRGSAALNTSTVVPLIGTDDFDQIEVSWFSNKDVSAGTTGLTFPDRTATKLPSLDKWGASSPAILRTQFIQTGGDFSLSDFEDTTGGKSDTNTLFLYPTDLSGLGPVDFTRDARRAGSAVPIATTCATSFASSDLYACSMKIKLPDPVKGSAASRGAFLRLSALYNSTHFSVQLYNTVKNTSVRFSGVQPEIDSTGRANSLFRRVKARVELTAPMVYPERAVDIAGNLCKNFFVTDDPNQYDPGTCTP